MGIFCFKLVQYAHGDRLCFHPNKLEVFDKVVVAYRRLLKLRPDKTFVRVLLKDVSYLEKASPRIQLSIHPFATICSMHVHHDLRSSLWR